MECTPGHPFYVPGEGFVAAGRLALGTSILTRAGPSVTLVQRELGTAPKTVYNLEVEDFHTYFVGESGFWVHNACGFAPGTGSTALDNMRAGGGHAIRYFRDLGLIPNTGSLASQVAAFKVLAIPILENPTAAFPWTL